MVMKKQNKLYSGNDYKTCREELLKWFKEVFEEYDNETVTSFLQEVIINTRVEWDYGSKK